jgi:hypothetical protein
VIKRFEDVTDADVLELTEREIERWIDVECACEGAPLLPPMPVEPAALTILPDLFPATLAGSADDIPL